MLTERKHTILQSLIQEYVISAHPVASSTLVRYYVPRLSSATVRNELSWLEEQGYVVAPHTSAGRMPTTVGYRTFVNSLLLHPRHFNVVINRAAKREDAKDTSAGVTHLSAPLAAPTKLASAADKFTLIHETLGLLAEYNKCLMVFWVPQLTSSIIHRGLPLLLSQPEFAETSAALPIMQWLESYGDLMVILEDVISTGGLHIKIGSEHKDSQLYEFSLVAKRFDCSNLDVTSGSSQVFGSAKGKYYGAVALFGPTRMDYEGAISSISSLVQDLESPGRQQ